jgi:putative sigma-54 modulation protein
MSRKSRAEAFVDEGYNITVAGRHVLVTEAMKNYAIEKISRLERFSPRLIDVSVAMDIQKLDHRVDIVMRFNNIKIKSHAATTDMYISLDMAIDKIQSQIRRYKNKIQDHHARGVKSIDMNVNVISPHREDELDEINGEIDEANQNSLIDRDRPHRVVAQETKPFKELTLDEAIMKMELSGDAFLIYRSEEDKKTKVMYRRKDRNYGVIEVDM